MPEKQISWTAPEYRYYPKSKAWRLYLIIATLLTLGYAVWNKDPIMFVTLLVIFAVAYGYSLRRPRTVTITLSGAGVAIDDLVYPYANLKAFWIHYQPPELKTLNLETTNFINRDIVIELSEQDPNQIREFLLQFLPEDLEHEEPQTDQILRRLKF